MAIRHKIVWASRVLTALALITVSTTPLWAQERTRLPETLRKHAASKSATQLDVIVRGTDDEVSAIAARHGVRIKKRLTEGAVLQANGAQIEAISNETPRVARDVEVRSFMSISNAAIGADQVQAGLAGMGPFTGAGIGIALIDSGVWTGHRSLAGRVVFAKDFVGDGKGTLRGQGPPD